MSTRWPRHDTGLAPWRMMPAVMVLVTMASLIGLSRELLRPSHAPDAAGIPGAPSNSSEHLSARSHDAVDALAAVPEQIWTVTLVDELFPVAPVAEPPPPPPPPLRLQLVAITGQGDARRVFVRDLAADRYHNLSPGDSVSTGIVLAAIDPAGATFEVAGRPVRLELPK